MMETHDTLVHPRPLADFLRRAPQTALLWDAHHTWRKGGSEIGAVWDLLRAHVVHIHVKDSVSEESPQGYRYVLPGTGEFPMGELRRRLHAADFQGAVSLEWERGWHPDLPPLEEALESAGQLSWW